jgi:hypothetical protein
MNNNIIKELEMIDNEEIKNIYFSVFKKMSEYDYKLWVEKDNKIRMYMIEHYKAVPIELKDNIDIAFVTLYKHLRYLESIKFLTRNHSLVIYNKF